MPQVSGKYFLKIENCCQLLERHMVFLVLKEQRESGIKHMRRYRDINFFRNYKKDDK